LEEYRAVPPALHGAQISSVGSVLVNGGGGGGEQAHEGHI
jgi:hypothetical protein